MAGPVHVEGWPADGADAQAHDLVCATCGERSRLHPADGFVAQVRVFLEQHRHGGTDDPPG